MKEDRKEPLVEALQQLVVDEDLGTLARLRESWREGREFSALSFVMPYIDKRLQDSEAAREESDALLVSALFATHRLSGTYKLPSAMAHLAKQTGSESIELRFRALLSADRRELPIHLRSAVMLVKEYPLNWHDLLRTIRHWDRADDSPDKPSARRLWASRYWGYQTENASAQDRNQEESAP